MSIYTRTGDRGKTSLGSGKRVWKDSLRVDAYGTVDELNSLIGVVIAEASAAASPRGPLARRVKKKHAKYLQEILTLIQSDLLCMGANLANPKDTTIMAHFPQRIKKFEQEIDYCMKKTPPLTSFILPQGGRIGSLLQLSRTVSRRAERKIITLAKKSSYAKGFGRTREDVSDDVVIYINRLSDLFLALARFADFSEGKKEIVWSRETVKK